MLQYYLGIPNPEELSDEEWAAKFVQLKEIRKQEKNKSIDDLIAKFGK